MATTRSKALWVHHEKAEHKPPPHRGNDQREPVLAGGSESMKNENQSGHTAGEQCSEKVYPNDRWGAFHPHQCSRKGSIKRDGKFYCKTHDPVAIKQKRAAQDAKWKKEFAESEKIDAVKRAAPMMLEALEAVKAEYESHLAPDQLNFKEYKMVCAAISKARGQSCPA
jgi:hypothetical protein